MGADALVCGNVPAYLVKARFSDFLDLSHGDSRGTKGPNPAMR